MLFAIGLSSFFSRGTSECQAVFCKFFVGIIARQPR
jgi:hypothetical protein